jgi:multisubunit Na+/H+ antiporter MnhF subunit
MLVLAVLGFVSSVSVSRFVARRQRGIDESEGVDQ